MSKAPSSSTRKDARSLRADFVFRLADRFQSARSEKELGSILDAETTKAAGLASFALLVPDEGRSFPWRVKFATWGEKNIEKYLESKDPADNRKILDIVGKTSSAFLWWHPSRKDDRPTVLPKGLFGVSRALVLPIYTQAGTKHISILGCDFDGSTQDMAAGHLICLYASAAVERLFPNPPPPNTPNALLSPRQRQCLQWVRAGKSSWEIGEILGLSEHTVNTHLEEARRRLGVQTTTQAVVEAGLRGLIHI